MSPRNMQDAHAHAVPTCAQGLQDLQALLAWLVAPFDTVRPAWHVKPSCSMRAAIRSTYWRAQASAQLILVLGGAHVFEPAELGKPLGLSWGTAPASNQPLASRDLHGTAPAMNVLQRPARPALPGEYIYAQCCNNAQAPDSPARLAVHLCIGRGRAVAEHQCCRLTLKYA